MSILRSLLFYVVFYTGSIGYAAVGATLMGISPARLGRTVKAWSRFHRLCARYLLGIRVVVEGTLPSSGVLMAMKHESFFEAIDAPYLVPFAAVVAKAELLRIPLWGKAAKAYGLVGVERDQGASALRVMLGEARQRIAAEPGHDYLSRRHARAARADRTARGRLCRALQAAEGTGGARSRSTAARCTIGAGSAPAPSPSGLASRSRRACRARTWRRWVTAAINVLNPVVASPPYPLRPR